MAVVIQPQAEAVDPITVEIIQSALGAITDEMFATMRKTAMSSIIYEVLDFGVAITNGDGELASSGSGIPGFVGMLAPGVRSVLAKHDRAAIRPGDVFMTNIPHHGGVSHLNDVVLMLPIFAGETLIAWLANKAHYVDVGGSFPGSIGPEAEDLYQEGLQLPCIKVIDAGTPNQAVLDIMAGNSRQPETTIGDFWAGVASMRAGARRFDQLISKYGADIVAFAMADYIALGEAIARAELAKLPKGTFVAHDQLDTGEPVQASITITDDAFVVDLRGNPPQRGDAMNTSFDATMVDVEMMFKAITAPQQFANAGSFRPVQLLVDEGSMFNARYPAAMSVYYETSMVTFDLLWKALAPALPELLPAAHYGSICGTFMGGSHPQTGTAQSIVEPQIGGWGATRDRDGVNALYTSFHGETYNVPVEVAEQRYGLRIDSLMLNDAPGGEGEFLGGKGIKLRYRVLADDWWITMAYVRSAMGPWGLEGGETGSTNYMVVHRTDGSSERFSSCTALKLNKDDVIEIITANGGGYGPARNRSQAQVREDLKNGYLLPERASALYGVKA